MNPKIPGLKPDTDGVTRLSGGNPQIAKGYGDAVVQSYIAALTGWQQREAKIIDSLITEAVPNVLKAVKWNSPLYGVTEHRYFLSFHAMKNYLKLGFFNGSELSPPPPELSKTPTMRYLHVTEAGFDHAQFTAWIKAAAQLPGEKM
jgi:hypothetical protein